MTSVEIWTARISTKDPDRYNISRKSGDPLFAPSWPLLQTYLAIHRTGRDLTPEEWREYALRYLREMAASWANNPTKWVELANKPRVVLTCYCTNHLRCHRKILANILVTKFGGCYHGEL